MAWGCAVWTWFSVDIQALPIRFWATWASTTYGGKSLSTTHDVTPPLEVWTLEHPQFGRLQAYVGWYEQLRAIDPDFPNPALVDEDDDEGQDDDAAAEPADDEPAQTDGSSDSAKESDEAARKIAEYHAKAQKFREDTEKMLGAERAERLRRWLIRDEEWKPRGLVITRDDVVIARLTSTKPAKMRLRTSMPAGEVTTKITTTDGNRIIVDVAAGKRFVTTIHVKTDDDVVAFDPPAGSKGAERQAAMDASPWKRVVYPILGGFGKAGWAISILILGPLFGKLLDPIIEFIAWLLTPIIQWLLDLIPDVSIPWPDIHLPQIDLPDIPWPDLPDIPWPSIDLPSWVVWLIDHPKTWTPIVLAIFLGIGAARNNKKSQATKAQWEEQKRQRELQRLASALRQVERRGECRGE